MLEFKHKEFFAKTSEEISMNQENLDLPLFKNIPGEEMPDLLKLLNWEIKEYEAGQTIVHSGDEIRKIGIILEGEAIISRNDYDGNRSIFLNLKRPSMFAESLFILGKKYFPLTITAASYAKVLFLDVSPILKPAAFPYKSELQLNFMKILAEHNLLFRQNIDILTHRTTREKLMCYLNYQAKAHGSLSFTIPYDRQALADYLGVERAALSAVISSLKKEGIINSCKSQFEILK